MNGKRALDVSVATVGLVALTPALLASAVAIKLESSGSAIFKQARVGLSGELFTIYKLRTMREGVGPLVSDSTNARITRVGNFLRKTKLDEAPQLFNVIQGTMSLVGPRPEVPEYVEMWPCCLRETILSVRPGITDPMAVRFRNEQDLLASKADPLRYYADTLLPLKAAGYAHYVENRSFSGDLRILWATVCVVVKSTDSLDVNP